MICLCLFSANIIAQEEALKALAEPFSNHSNMLFSNPQRVVDTLLSSKLSGSDSPLALAQYHLILSQAYYYLSYPKKSLEQAKMALSHTSVDSQPWLYYSCKITLANALELTGQPSEAMPGLNSAIKWAIIQKDTILHVRGLYFRGIVHTKLADYVLALEDLNLAYTLTNNNPNTINRSHVAGMLAQVYTYRGENGLAIPYFEEAVRFHRKFNSHLELSISLFGLGKANRNIGLGELGRKQLQESADFAQKIDDIQGVAYALKELSIIDADENKYSESENKLLQAADIFSRADNQLMNLNMMMALAKLSIKTNDLNKSHDYMQQAKNALDKTNTPIPKIYYNELNAKLLYLQKNYRSAYDNLMAAFSDYRKYHNTNSTERLHQLRSKYEVQLAEHNNQLLSQKNDIQKLEIENQKNSNFLLIIISVLAIITSGFLVVIVVRNKTHKRRLEKLATIDELTGLYNRRQILYVLKSQMVSATRHQKGLCVAMIDIDWFKLVNDTYGHSVGDKILKQFSKICQESLRESDIVGRIGGEEFLLVLTHTSLNNAYNILEKLRCKVAELGKNKEKFETPITISGGVAECQSNDNVESLILLADNALYKAKDNGRNQIVICDR